MAVGAVGVGLALLELRREARLAGERQPRRDEAFSGRRARYEQLRYCEGCHLIFDPDGRSEPADRDGFERLLGG